MTDAREKLRAWAAVDELVLEVYGLTKPSGAAGSDDLSAAMRGAALRSALRTTHAVQGRPDDLGATLGSALSALGELRYFLYLSRRLGLIDLRRYRSACARHERAQRILRALIPAAAGGAADGPEKQGVRAVEASSAVALAPAFAPFEVDREV